jgi:hypothetical protein
LGVSDFNLVAVDEQIDRLFGLPVNHDGVVASELELGPPSATEVAVGEHVVCSGLAADGPSGTTDGRQSPQRSGGEDDPVGRL